MSSGQLQRELETRREEKKKKDQQGKGKRVATDHLPLDQSPSSSLPQRAYLLQGKVST